MKVAEEFKRNTGLDSNLRTWVPSASKELDVLRNGPLTVAVLNCDLVDSICMENQHTRMARNRVITAHAGVVKLDFKSQSLEGGLNKPGSQPFLESKVH